MSPAVLVLAVVIIMPLIYRNADSAQKQRVKTTLKVIISLWVLVTLFMIAIVGLKTHWANIPALLLVSSIPFAIIMGAYQLMVRTIMK